MESYQEKAETLSSRFGISRMEAMKSLEECDGDILDAVNLLECKGIIKRASVVYTTHTPQPPAENAYGRPSDGNIRRVEYNSGAEVPSFGQKIISGAEELFQKSIEYKFKVWKEEEKLISVPVLAVVIAAAAAVWVTLSVLAVGLLAGYRYEIIKE